MANFVIKKMKRRELIADLKARTHQNIEELVRFSDLSSAELNHRNTPQSWSILECMAHLNLYGDFYLPEIDNCIKHAQPSDNEDFESGWLGNYFAVSMLPGENGKLNKMKTFKSMNPIHKSLSPDVLVTFKKQQHEMLRLLDIAHQVDLGKTKTSISISKWIKLRLGDTLRVVIYHNQRHMRQAQNVLKVLQAV